MRSLRVGLNYLFASWVALTCFHESATAQIEWRALAADGDQKHILAYFPDETSSITDTVDTALGAMPFTTYYVQDDAAASGNLLYMLTTVEYPVGAFPPDSTALIEAFFQSTLQSATSAVGGELRFAEARNKPYPGYIFRIDYGEEDPRIVRNHAYLVGSRYYHLQVFSWPGEGGERSRRRFFESFKPLVSG